MNSSSSKSKQSKYENSKNTETPSKILDNSDLSKSNNDIMLKIDKEAQNLKSNIKQKDLKIFSKYEDLSEEELLKLIKEKNEDLIKLSDEKDKRKNDLNKIIKKLNKAISNNADLLYKEETDPDTLIELQKIIESKKKALKISKSMNQTFKNQYNSIINRASGSKTGNAGKNGNDAETHLIELKNENKNLELEIRKYKDDGISKQKELEIICEDKIYPGKIKKKTDENQNLLNQKHEYHKKIGMSLNSIKNLIKELNHLEQIYSEVKNEKNKDKENLDNKILFWTDIIKSDLNGNEQEIIERVVKNETKFIKEIDKKVNNNEANDKIRSTSPDINEKISINKALKKIKVIKNLEIDETDNNKYNGKIINKGKNSKLIYSYTSGKNILTSITNRYKMENTNPPKGVFAKFSFLKQKPSTSESKSNTKTNQNQNNIEEKKEEKKLEKLLEKDYNDTTDSDYRELLDKKTQYLETNYRLEENIKKIQRTTNKKHDSVFQIIQDNINRLDLLKAKNDLLNKEINNLLQVFQLTLEQEKIKYELKQKENQIKKGKEPIAINKLDISSLTEKAILNEMKESNDLLIPQKNKNKSGYYMEKKEKIEDNETREEKLEKIKKKYREMNDESIEEIKE